MAAPYPWGFSSSCGGSHPCWCEEEEEGKGNESRRVDGCSPYAEEGGHRSGGEDGCRVSRKTGGYNRRDCSCHRHRSHLPRNHHPRSHHPRHHSLHHHKTCREGGELAVNEYTRVCICSHNDREVFTHTAGEKR